MRHCLPRIEQPRNRLSLLEADVDAPVDVLDLDAALTELAELDPREARVVELRFFSGLSMDEVAAALSISLATAEREWRAARAWLAQRLNAGGNAP